MKVSLSDDWHTNDYVCTTQSNMAAAKHDYNLQSVQIKTSYDMWVSVFILPANDVGLVFVFTYVKETVL